MSALHINVQDEFIYIEGDLTRQQLTKAFIEQHEQLFKKPEVIIDLSTIKKVDTAGLAWLLLLVEKSESSKDFKFKNLPNDLLKLAKLSGVESFLSLA